MHSPPGKISTVFSINLKTESKPKPKPPTKNAGIVSWTAQILPWKGCFNIPGATWVPGQWLEKSQIMHYNPGEFTAWSSNKETVSFPGRSNLLILKVLLAN